MAVKKSSLSLESSESDSELLPVFAFLKKEPSSTKREEKIVVIDTSDSEASCPLSPRLKDPPHVPDTAETVTQIQPVRALSSGSEDEEELIPLAERLTCKFLRHKQLSPEDSSFPVKRVWDHQNNEGASCDWKKQSFPKIPDVPLYDTAETCASNNKDPVVDNQCHQVPGYQATCPVQSNSLTATKTNAEVPLPRKRTKHNQKVQRRGSQGCQPRGQASQKEGTLRQQERKKAAALVNRPKAQRPEECLKHIIVVLDPGPLSICLHSVLSYLFSGPPSDAPFTSVAVLLQTEGGGQLLGALQSMECCCVIEAQAVPCSITWRRRAGTTEDGEEGWVEEPMVLVLLLTEAFVSMIYNFKQGSLGSNEKGKETLRSFVTDITARTAGKALSLCSKNSKEKETGYGKQRTGQGEKEAENTRGQCRTHGVQGRHGGDSDWAGGVKVDRAGRGLAQVWRRQIQQLNRVSLEMASAVVATYPSPQLLVQAYRRCFSEQECQNLLADIQVRRGEGVTSTSRRVGPELSRRIYLQMTTLQPDLSLDSAD
ncbi:crossover junction endonuclease EME1 isoform 3-T4 [Hipposideros larvatus]